jgi:SAM-dependent methyltransferase
VGFKEEGRFLRQQWNNGRYVDWVFMGIFRADWDGSTSSATASTATEPVEVAVETVDLISYNQERWDALVAADVAYSRPLLDLDEEAARKWILNEGWVPPSFLEQIAGKDVLCLASGGGQQTAVFGTLGANVTVLDFSGKQLDGDRKAAAHYGYDLHAVQGVMTDLSVFADNSFDIIWHPYSINFIPDPQPVFDEVARVLRPNGLYRLTFSNPFRAGIDDESWCGDGYAISHPYVDGTEMWADEPEWMVEGKDGSKQPVAGPKEFNHTLGAIVNGLAGRGFGLLHLWEDTGDTLPDLTAKPGSWAHFIAIAPPYLGVWMRKNL